MFYSWDKFKKGKRSKHDVMLFERDIEQHIFDLHHNLKNKTYKHDRYFGFYISDPKIRHIHKATVRDRIVHHALFTILNPIFEPTFIQDSFSCRIGKGNHVGVKRLEQMTRRVSKNYTNNCFALKCDIKKFFDTIDHDILRSIIFRRVTCLDTRDLISGVIDSFEHEVGHKKGLPIGNLTSQLFCNIYMNEFDQFVKHTLRYPHYLRYTDDFIFLADSKDDFDELLKKVIVFLRDRLALELHDHKIITRSVHQGIDFLGYIVRPHHKLIRTKTKSRMMRRFEEQVRLYRSGEIDEETLNASLQSYLGVLSHADTYKVEQELKNRIVTTD